MGGCLCIAQRKCSHFAGVGPDIRKVNSFKGNGGISYWRGNKWDTFFILWRIWGSKLGIKYRQGNSAWRKTTFPGALREAEAGTHFYSAAQCDVLSQHCIHFFRNNYLVTAHTCWEKKQSWDSEIQKTEFQLIIKMGKMNFSWQCHFIGLRDFFLILWCVAVEENCLGSHIDSICVSSSSFSVVTTLI